MSWCLSVSRYRKQTNGLPHPSVWLLHSQSKVTYSNARTIELSVSLSSDNEEIFNLKRLDKNTYRFSKSSQTKKALWATMRNSKIKANLVRVIENLYDKATSTVLFSCTTGKGFMTPAGVKHSSRHSFSNE